MALVEIHLDRQNTINHGKSRVRHYRFLPRWSGASTSPALPEEYKAAPSPVKASGDAYLRVADLAR
jgi:hypothetical protein